jgi:hypothetical protein
LLAWTLKTNIPNTYISRCGPRTTNENKHTVNMENALEKACLQRKEVEDWIPKLTAGIHPLLTFGLVYE